MPVLGPKDAAMLLGLSAFLISGPTQSQSVYEALFGLLPTQPPAAAFHSLHHSPRPFREIERPPLARRAFERDARETYDLIAPRRPAMPAEAKPARVTPDADLVASLMADPTLRRGDVVVFPDGPRVYRGERGSSRRLRDFEPVQASRLVDESTRRTVLAGTRSTTAQVAVSASRIHRSDRDLRPDAVAITGAIPVRAAVR